MAAPDTLAGRLDRAFSNNRVWIRLAAAIVLFNGLFPAVWILLTSLKTDAELSSLPVTYLPADPTLQNYFTAFSEQPLLRYLFNSFVVASASTALAIFVSSLAAYAIARLRVPFRAAVLATLVAVSTFPMITLMVPLFQTMRAFGILNTYLALILPYTVLSLPVCTLVLVSFFAGIPRDLENAAMIDGCTRLGALRKVIVPLAAPGVFTAGLLAFVNAWDEFLLALSLTSSQQMRTVSVGITLYQGEYVFPWPLISAALIVALVPITILIVIFQERVVSGLTAGGVKG
ncbi:MAG: carbohydrate ABC transporter permease [Azospirillaceae bacterium]